MKHINYVLIKFKNSNLPIAVGEALFYDSEFHIHEETLVFFQSQMTDLKYFRDLYSLGYKKNKTSPINLSSNNSLIYDKYNDKYYPFNIVSAFIISYRDYNEIIRVMSIINNMGYDSLCQLQVDIYDSKLFEQMQSKIRTQLLHIKRLNMKIDKLKKSNNKLKFEVEKYSNNYGEI